MTLKHKDKQWGKISEIRATCVWTGSSNLRPRGREQGTFYSTISFSLFSFLLFPIYLSFLFLLVSHFCPPILWSGLSSPRTCRGSQNYDLAQDRVNSYRAADPLTRRKKNRFLALLREDSSLKYSSSFDWALRLCQTMTRIWRGIRYNPGHKDFILLLKRGI